MNLALKIFGIEISGSDLGQLSAEVNNAIAVAATPLLIACANPHSLVVSLHDELFRKALKQTKILVADGMGVAMAGRYLKRRKVQRITGFDVFSATMQQLEESKGSVFFFGSSIEVLERITNKINVDYPNVRLAGVLSPPFGDWSHAKNNEMIDSINQSNADVLWVGMTAPKQEKWASQNFENLDVKVIGSIGAVFDFYAETKPRAPEWMCRLGVEWLHRLIKEPKRMWRRNFVSTPLFLFLVFKELIGIDIHAK
jgi:N-acetylglucosaminyldiphosphoundecaprenol N-acetyl-beta-D-mannosaminyltransferase